MTTKRKKSNQPKERTFTVTVVGANCKIFNDAFTDIEMVGILTVLLDAYKEIFNTGGGADGEEGTQTGGKA